MKLVILLNVPSTEELGEPHRAGPKAAEAGPKRSMQEPLGVAPEHLSFTASSGAVSRALNSILLYIGLSG